MSKVILPIEEKPLFLSRYESSVYFSVIQAQANKHEKDITPWLAGLMANYQHSTRFRWEYDTIKRMDWYANQKLFFKKFYRYDNRMPALNGLEIKNLLIHSLRQGKYVHLQMNTFFLPNDVSYQAYHRAVECLLYGFDDDNQEFYFIRFFPSKPITLCTASFDDVLNAVCKKEDHQIILDILQFNEDFTFRLDEKTLYNDLYDFLHSTRQIPQMTPNCDIQYGVESLNRFRDYISKIGVYYEYMDRKYFSSFYDFQTIIYIRYRYLKENGYLLTDNSDQQESKLPILSKQFLMDCITFNQTQNGKLLKEIIRIFNEIAEIDIHLSQIMLNSLRRHIELGQKNDLT